MSRDVSCLNPNKSEGLQDPGIKTSSSGDFVHGGDFSCVEESGLIHTVIEFKCLRHWKGTFIVAHDHFLALSACEVK